MKNFTNTRQQYNSVKGETM